MRQPAWLTGCLAIVCVAALAQDAAPQGSDPAARAAARDRRGAAEALEWNRNPAPQDPRDFSGVWWTRGYDRTFRPVTDTPMAPGESARLLPLTASIRFPEAVRRGGKLPPARKFVWSKLR